MAAPYKKVIAAAAAVFILTSLSGCASPGAGGSNSVTITWSADGNNKSKTFTVSDPTCSDFGARTLSFPDTPVRSLAVIKGLEDDDVEAWIYENEQAVVFKGQGISLTVDQRDDGSVEYSGTKVAGRVAVTELTNASSAAPPDVDAAIENAQQFDATIDFAVTCPPAE